MSSPWAALLAAAGRRDDDARLPWFVLGRPVGSVARLHLPALAAWHRLLQVQHDARGQPQALHWRGAAHTLDADLTTVNAALRAQGLVRGWRDELFALFDPVNGETLAALERAACRFWGTLTLGAHANGYIADATGRPTHLWLATRSLGKPTDPGLQDNLVGGGVPAGQTPFETLQREAWEEAGLAWHGPALLRHQAAPHALRLHRDVPEGRQLELLQAWDLQLDPAWRPENQDGEVAAVQCLPVHEALACTPAMTLDAALVTLDFGLRHGLLHDVQQAETLRALRVASWSAWRP